MAIFSIIFPIICMVLIIAGAILMKNNKRNAGSLLFLLVICFCVFMVVFTIIKIFNTIPG